LKSIFDNSDILITGGTGSFGTAFVEYILKNYNPSRLIIFSRDEFKQFNMSQKIDKKYKDKVRFFIGDVRDKERLRRAMNKVNVVIHAAAMKHVAASEYNPIEAIKTNIIGAENVINTSIDEGVSNIIALSTDKAANPMNLYGATKLCSDKLFVAANNIVGSGSSKFSVVRYGNVLGSRGSVVEIFKNIVKNKKGFIPITDPDMTRFWITLEQGVKFVISCIDNMVGGEIFIPKIPSMKLIDMANHLAPGYKHKIIGIRSGEKLHEVMITKDDAINTLEFKDRYIIIPRNIIKYTNKSYMVYKEKGRSVDKDFEYSSDNNSEWLDKKALQNLIGS